VNDRDPFAAVGVSRHVWIGSGQNAAESVLASANEKKCT
jgi:hypothetical protein